LAPGADVIESTFNAYLEVFNTAGNEIGLFLLSDTDAQLSLSKQEVQVNAGINIEYSILSTNNNDAVDTILQSDYATGLANGINFTDLDTDFLGLGTTTDGKTFISVVSPANVVGKYEILSFVPDGNNVNSLVLKAVNDENEALISNTFSILDTSLPTGSTFIYGFPTGHELAAAPYSDVNNTTGATIGLGIGVVSTLASLSGADVVKLIDVTPCYLPGANSNAAVILAPGAPESGGEDDTGSATPHWQDAFASIQVGDWVRATGTFGSGVTIRDFQIVAINTTALSITLQNPDATGVGVPNLTITSAITAITFLSVLNGTEDAANAAGDYLTGTAQGVPFSLEIAMNFSFPRRQFHC
jgi:hypothetical protein